MTGRQYRPRTMDVLRQRKFHNPRLAHYCYRSLLSPEAGLTGPVYTSIAYGFSSAEEAARVFETGDGYAYARMGRKTPTVNQLEEALADLELGANCPWRSDYGAVVYSSGMSAIFNLALNLADRGRGIVSSPYLYGGTYHLFAHVFPRLGIECVMVDNPLWTESWLAGISKAKHPVCLFAEDNANPMIVKLDNQAIARLAHSRGLLYVCDMTVTTPFLEQPLMAADAKSRPDAVVHSLSKNINGHSDCLGGAVIARKNLIEDTKDFFGLAEYFPLIGGVMDARVADVILYHLRGAEERVLKKTKNAEEVAVWLKKQPAVKTVYGPGCDLLSFEIRGNLDDARRVVEAYQLINFAPHLGDISTLSIHPASTTHAKIPPEERRKLGITDSLIRLSVGLEDPEDIIDDLEWALGKI